MKNVYNSPWKFPIFCTKIWMLWYYYYYAKCILFILICGTHLDLSLWPPPLLSICLLFSSQINSDGKYKDKDKTNTKTKQKQRQRLTTAPRNFCSYFNISFSMIGNRSGPVILYLIDQLIIFWQSQFISLLVSGQNCNGYLIEDDLHDSAHLPRGLVSFLMMP